MPIKKQPAMFTSKVPVGNVAQVAPGKILYSITQHAAHSATQSNYQKVFDHLGIESFG
jgi:hypothetical protein